MATRAIDHHDARVTDPYPNTARDRSMVKVMSALHVCPTEEHERLKADPKQWEALPSLGIVEYELDEGLVRCDHRNCPKPGCQSTLIVKLPADR